MKRKEDIRIVFENEVNKPRFSMDRLFSTLADSGVFDSLLERVVKLRELLLDKKLNPYAPVLSDIYSAIGDKCRCR